MAGFDNEVLFALGERLQPSTALAITLMQQQATDIARINFTGNPNGSVAANPASLCHDPSSGTLYLKTTGTGNTGWVQLNAGVVSPTTSNATPQFSAGNLDFRLDYLNLGSTAAGLVSAQSTTGFGFDVLKSITSTNGCTAFGNQALLNDTTGVQNTAVGASALSAITISSACTAVGWSALLNNTQVGITGVGWSALGANTSGSQNTGIGYNVLATNQTGAGNAGVGFSTLMNCTGSLNTAIGGSAGLNVAGGGGNIFIGQNSGVAYTTTESNNICLGSFGVVGESNVMRLGIQGTGSQQQSVTYIAGQMNGLSGRSYKITTPGAYPYTALITDHVLLVDTSAARTINLPAAPTNTPVIIVKDNVGTAATNNITISGNGNNIDGSASITIGVNYGSMTLVYNGTQWNVI